MDNIKEDSIDYLLAQYLESVEKRLKLDEESKEERRLGNTIRDSILEKLNLDVANYIKANYQNIFDNVDITDVSVLDRRCTITISYADISNDVYDNITIPLEDETFKWDNAFKQGIVRYFHRCMSYKDNNITSKLTDMNVYVDYNLAVDLISDEIFVFIYNKINKVLESKGHLTIKDMIASFLNKKFSFLPVVELDEMLERVAKIRLLESIK